MPISLKRVTGVIRGSTTVKVHGFDMKGARLVFGVMVLPEWLFGGTDLDENVTREELR